MIDTVSPSLTTALMHAPMGIAIFDRSMRYLAHSAQYLTDQGLPADLPLLGRVHYEVFPEIPQFWRDLHARVLNEGVELREDGGDRYVDRHGRVEWIRWSMAPWRTDEGAVGGLVLYTEVVTAAVEARLRLEAAEARYKAVFEQAAMGVARISPRGVFLEVNDRFCAITRRSRQVLVAGNAAELIAPQDLPGAQAHVRALLAGRLDTYAAERRLIAGDGEVLWIRLTVSKVQPRGGLAYLVAIIADITARKVVEAEQERHQGQLRLLINELNHRVKNTLATVQSMAAQTLRNEPDPVTAFEKFELRLLGLSLAHDVLTRESWHGADLCEVAQRALAPFTAAAGRVSVAGPPCFLPPGGALTMSLVFHELATNALKYGALSNLDGSVAVAWRFDEATRALSLTWTETGGPRVEGPPSRRGFGSRLIERSLRGELRGQVRMEWREEGLVCRLEAVAPLPTPPSPELGVVASLDERR
ncbi:histidine kinase [Caulobacter zeae]|uniref:histidine kinase n=1 Tax=Caulobacter zeae TaxID=2055137 RepID=A0A2N5DS91_9CAUL|nr:HWE histidine kinase domain-containing protein [Caulobacter zeae]PLR28925.1 histidine kinase [Caulobacter zeae]